MPIIIIQESTAAGGGRPNDVLHASCDVADEAGEAPVLVATAGVVAVLPAVAS